MEISLEIVNVGFFIVLLTWVLLDTLRRRRRRRDGTEIETYLRDRASRGCKGFALVTLIANALISVFYVVFGIYDYCGSGNVSLKSIFSGMTWVLATIVTIYSNNEGISEHKRWPWVLIFWWIFSFIFCSLSMCLYFVTHYLKSIKLPDILPKANIVEFASFPLSMLLCCHALSYIQEDGDLREPLLAEEYEIHTDSYTDAGIWSKVTFQWLNPLFERGRNQKLELSHIPSIPPSARAESASFLLQESLEHHSSLLKAILRAGWKSLAINAIFAEIRSTNSLTVCERGRERDWKWKTLTQAYSDLRLQRFQLAVETGLVWGQQTIVGLKRVVSESESFLHLLRCLFREWYSHHQRERVIGCRLLGLNVVASYIGPFLIRNFMKYIVGKYGSSNMYYGEKLAFIFFFAMTLESITQRQLSFGARQIGLQVRAALTTLIYKKCISIKYFGPSNGKVVNLINMDVEVVGEFFSSIHGVWVLPLQVFLALVILYGNLGAAPSLAAFLTTVAVLVCNTPLARRQQNLQSKIMEAKDSRIKRTSETLKSMRVVKFNSWENSFLEKLLQLRETEKSWLKRFLYTKATVVFLFWASPTIVSVITFGTCIMMRTTLEPYTVLSALATFRILTEPIYNLPEFISMIIQTKVSIKRIQDFIRLEKQVGLIPRDYSCSTLSTSEIMVEMEAGEFSWKESNEHIERPTITIREKITMRKGCKVGVCGSVGSGKSSLLCGILGEIPKISGQATKCYGKKSYVAQSPWIQTGTVRDNILFGKEVNEGFYKNIVECCAMNKDFKMWSNGDMTVVGERGMSLSGGQKQRIQLARAVYNDADVYILDDPFSAVDAHTGTHLFKKCILQELSEKTVIYATHQLEFLEAADYILINFDDIQVVKDGQIAQSGTYEKLIEDPNGELVRQMTAHRKSLHHVHSSPPDSLSNTTTTVNMKNGITERVLDTEETERASTNDQITVKEIREEEEEAQTGRVKWSVYSTFLTCALRGLLPVILLCHVLFQVLQMASNYWIAWAVRKENTVTRGNMIWIFACLSGGSSVFVLGRAVFLSVVTIETSQHLFVGMITSVFRAPMAFFDSTPSSQILTRSSTDQSTVDTDITFRLGGLVFALIQLACTIILMCLVAWQVFILFLVVIAISFWYMKYYITTARELARMVATQKAPILHHFSESIAGATTIRCFNQQNRFLTKAMNEIDDFSRVALHNNATMEWLSVRINFLFNVAFLVVLIVLVNLPKSVIDPSLAGVAASYGLNLSVLQGWVIWNLCNVENKMISVQRILQFTGIQSEAPLVIEASRPNSEWLTEGQIEFQNVQVQYQPEGPMVLKGISCTFSKRMKIGVVGRTGSGKSTMIQALFRVVELSGGKILIDEQDISKIGLQDLRSILGIIPQDPTLFQGSLRTNLDPLQQHSDPEMLEVVKKCRLGNLVRPDQMFLDAPVSEDGENWSVGQRQLICLARVLLKKRKILVLDEATASIDTATDNAIQETIRKETSECTVITVAHRIPTVMDSDMVLVLDEGRIVEYDSPARLIKESSSAFSKLVVEFLRRSSRRKNNCSS
ncbi:putative xenobiotic-transporting ATPase [Rosa chinensis]|uniref:ABC-type xenobiotic transporter n=1 Tax=Rosa chinensis TaxID=74649 RepID=A0A2P6Q027_ROSCH|nr:putative xenobiotic-transporting ATPase [Rosa chinensis]